MNTSTATPNVAPQFGAVFLHKTSLENTFGHGETRQLREEGLAELKMTKRAERATHLDAFVMGETEAGQPAYRIVYQNRKTGQWERTETRKPTEFSGRENLYWKLTNTMYRLAAKGAYDKQDRSKTQTPVTPKDIAQVQEAFPRQFNSKTRYLFAD